MPITLACRCGKQLQIGEMHAGKQGRCPSCDAVLEIPPLDIPAGLPSLAPEATAQAAPLGGMETIPPAGAPEAVPGRDEALIPPWQQPEPGDGPARPPRYRKLHSPLTLAGAAGLGGFVAGGLVLSANYRSMGKAQAATAAVVAGIFATAVSLVFVQVHPAARASRLMYSLSVFAPPFAVVGLVQEGFSGAALLLLPPVVVFGVAELTQARAYRAHVRAGGNKHPWWTAAGTGLATAGLCGSVIFGVYLLHPREPSEREKGGRVEIGPQQVVLFEPGTSRAEAQRLGDALRDLGYLRGMPVTVRLARGPDGFIVSVIPVLHDLDDPRVLEEFRALGQQLSWHAFDGKPVEIWLCDGSLRHLRTVP